ncbi:unnamed protein product [Leuciscus chuanchicus]
MGAVSHRKVISTEASNLGWGALFEGKPVFGLWSDQEKCLHINCLEIIVIENVLKRFLPHIRDHHVLVRSDNMSMVSYVNRQGGVRSRNLGAVHVPGHLNVGPDRLSRDNIPPGEWFLHPQTVQLLWHLFGRAEVNLFGSKDNAHCPTFFSNSEDVLAQTWPSRPLYAFPPISLLPQGKNTAPMHFLNMRGARDSPMVGLYTGISGVDHVFISSGENVRLSCNNALSDCKSKTIWIYNRFSHLAAVALIELGINNKDTERHERLSLESDYSLNIKNVTEEDYGFYTCRQWIEHKQQGPDVDVYLNVLHGQILLLNSDDDILCISGEDHVFISSGGNVRLSCNNALPDCKSKTTWIYYNRFRDSAVELIKLGINNKDKEKHERLSLESDCSLNIKNVTEEDYGLYVCQQQHRPGTDAHVFLFSVSNIIIIIIIFIFTD